MSARAGLSETYYGMIERGQRRPSRAVLDRLAGILNLLPGERAETMGLLHGAHRAASEGRSRFPGVAEPGPGEEAGEPDIRPLSVEYVVDASVLVKPFTRHDEADRARSVALLQAHAERRCRVVLPDFARLEILNAVRFGRRAVAGHTTEVLLALQDLGLRFAVLDHSTLERAVALSWTQEISIYDAAYVALAEHLEAPLVTADTKLFNRVRGHRLVTLLADFEVP